MLLCTNDTVILILLHSGVKLTNCSGSHFTLKQS